VVAKAALVLALQVILEVQLVVLGVGNLLKLHHLEAYLAQALAALLRGLVEVAESSTKLWDQLHSLVLWRVAAAVLAAQAHTIFLVHIHTDPAAVLLQAALQEEAPAVLEDNLL
jgi:hypothetical protein